MRLRLLIASVAMIVFLIAACESDSKIEIVGQSAERNIPLLGEDSVIVKCQLRNEGSAVTITVKAEVNAENGYWTKRKTVGIGDGETREVVIEFPEADFALFSNNPVEYNCGWES